MKTKDLDSVAILGLGLLGGSLGLALDRVNPDLKRSGYSHRSVTRRKALKTGTVDTVFPTATQAVENAQLVILASPIGTFPQLMIDIADHLPTGCIVTDVGSTKRLPAQWAKTYLPKHVHFLGSHPMAGSEQRGVEYARADLFDQAHCILTPTTQTKKSTLTFLTRFWKQLHMNVTSMSPTQHDRVLARISHLPHALAAALVNASDSKQLLLCGKGFLDTTRIASGPPGVWRDIFMANPDAVDDAIDKLIRQLTRIQKTLKKRDHRAILKLLTDAQSKRNQLVKKKLQLKELPA